jgi:alpha-L-rhamnosidase
MRRVKRKIELMGWAMVVSLMCAAAAFSPRAIAAEKDAALAAKNLRCEYTVDPVGIDVRKPRLSWELVSVEKGVMQTSYEVRVAGSEAELAKGKVIWDSGTQASDASIQVEYGGPAVASGRIYYWQVRVADNHGHLSEWSRTARWEMGLLEAGDWKAKWIAPDLVEDETKSNPSPLLRREFLVKKKVERARIYATAMGLYELDLNGKRVGDFVINIRLTTSPAW